MYCFSHMNVHTVLGYSSVSLPLYVTLHVQQVWPGTTAFPDFFNPATDDYWLQHAKSFHDLIPFDGLWIVSTF